MINLALFSHSNALAGAERMLFNLAKSLNNIDKYDIKVFIPQNNIFINEFSLSCHESGIDYIFLEQYPYYIFNNNDNIMPINISTQKAILEIEHLLRKHNIGVVIVNTLVSMPAILAARKLGLPVITWVHGILDPVSARGIASNISFERQLYLDRMLLSLSNEVVYCSDWTKRYYDSYIDTPGVTINNWTIEKSKVESPAGTCKFVCLNTFDKYKGVETLVEAAKIVKMKGYEFELDIYGDGAEVVKKALNDKIKKNNLDEHIKLKGRVVDTSKVYEESSCLVQPSYLESFGLTVIEAMAHSRPVIVAKSGGPENIVIDGETGYLVEKNDANAIADKMISIILNPEKNKKLGTNAFEDYSKKYDGKLSIGQFENIIRSLCKRETTMTNTEKLMYQSIINIIDLEINGNINGDYIYGEYGKVQKNHTINKIKIPSNIIFSKLINKERRYMLNYSGDKLSEIGIIFASFINVSGNGFMEIYVKNRRLRKIEFNLENILQNQWNIFSIEPLSFRNEATFEIKFSFQYNEGSGHVGVFHNQNRNTMYNRLLSKLNIDTKDKDILCVHMN